MQVAVLLGRLDFGEKIDLAELYIGTRVVVASQYSLGDKIDFLYPSRVVDYLQHNLLGRGLDMDMAHSLGL